MNKLTVSILTVTLLATLLACKASGSIPTPTQPAAPPVPATEAPTQAPPAFSGKPVAIGGVAFSLPEQVAGQVSSTSSTELELPYINGPDNLPLHTVLTLGDYFVQGSKIQPKIIVFKASDYAGYDERAAKTIAALQAPYQSGQPLPDPLKCFLCAQMHPLRFQNGQGIALVEQVNSAPAPVNNAEMFYSFRGLTSDGQYYVQVELPVQVAFLAAGSQLDAPIPAGGVAFDGANFSGYMAAIRQKLAGAAAGDFSPALAQLDALLQSLMVTGL